MVLKLEHWNMERSVNPNNIIYLDIYDPKSDVVYNVFSAE